MNTENNMVRNKHRMAVFGSGSGSEKQLSEKLQVLAFEIGKEIAKHDCVLVTGGCKGLPYAGAKGAKSVNGKTVAYSPGIDKEDHINTFNNPIDAYDKFIFTPKHYKFSPQAAMKYRNVISCNESDACIIIGGRIGTLDEFTHMYDMGKVIGIIQGSGGVSTYIKEIIKIAAKDTGAAVIFDKDPKGLVKKVIEQLEKNLNNH